MFIVFVCRRSHQRPPTMNLIENKLCRTCESCDGTSVSFVSLRTELVPGVLLAEALVACAPVEVTETDGLPQHLCNKCTSSLREAYTFQAQCVRIHDKFKLLISNGVLYQDDKVDIKAEPEEILFKDETPDDEYYEQIEVSIDEMALEEKVDTKEKSHYECHKCQEQFSNEENFTEHIRGHGETKFTCNICKKEFAKFTRFKRHLSTHRKGKQYQCSVCYKRYAREESLVRHMVMHTIDIKTEIEEFKCPRCDKCFKLQKSLSSHMRKHRGVDSDVYTCDECGKGCSSKSLLNRHVKLHGEDRPYKCDKCSKSYSRQDQLIEHLNKHNGVKPNVCPYCNKAFSQLCNLKDHVRTHTGETPYLCSQCGKGFNNGSNLRQHMMRHSGLKPFACTLCPKRFSTKGQMTSHSTTHSRVHPFVCDSCGSSFTKPSSLKKHKLIHLGVKPHECDVCFRRFSGKDHLKRHYRIHTGEKPYKCKFCERAFTQSNDLIKHTRSHVGQNIYQCTVCNLRFRLLSELKLHYPVHYSNGAPSDNNHITEHVTLTDSSHNDTDARSEITLQNDTNVYPVRLINNNALNTIIKNSVKTRNVLRPVLVAASSELPRATEFATVHPNTILIDRMNQINTKDVVDQNIDGTSNETRGLTFNSDKDVVSMNVEKIS